jgi:hypothetical protein
MNEIEAKVAKMTRQERRGARLEILNVKLRIFEPAALVERAVPDPAVAADLLERDYPIRALGLK